MVVHLIVYNFRANSTNVVLIILKYDTNHVDFNVNSKDDEHVMFY